jgi:hypothetical protein
VSPLRVLRNGRRSAAETGLPAAAILFVAAALTASACSSPAGPTSPAASTDTVDVLDFIIGAPDQWPRHGNQAQHQIVDWTARQVCWVKYVNPSRFECWGWDDQWVYHLVDHALDGNSGESYRFTDGRWLPRKMARSGAWTVEIPGNRIRWFTASCVEVRGPQGVRVDDGPNLYPMSQQAWIETRDAGELGAREVLILASASHPPGAAPNAPERFYFARGAGWYMWDSVRGSVSFDRLGGPTVALGPGCGR